MAEKIGDRRVGKDLLKENRFKKNKERAFSAMKALGIPAIQVSPVLQDLLEVYAWNWELIEADNYQVLIDAFFDIEKQGVDNEKECVSRQEGTERPSKRLQLGQQKDNLSSAVAVSRKTSAPEEAELPMTIFEQGRKKPSQPCLTGGNGSSSLINNAQLHCKRKDLISYYLAPRERISTRSGKSEEVSLKQPLDEHESSRSLRENPATPALNRKKFIKPKTEEPVSGRTRHSKPISVDCPGSLVISSLEAVRNHGDSLPAEGLKEKASRIGDSERDPNEKSLNHSGCINSSNLSATQKRPVSCSEKRSSCRSKDITKGAENVQIALIDETCNCNEDLPKFTYIPHNLIYQDAYVHISLARISDEDCCPNCSGDCLSVSIPCACARETGGEFAYTQQGLLKEEFLGACMSMKKGPCEEHLVYCHDCPLERSNNERSPEKCKGHVVRKFIKECWRKCGCSMQCGNRIVQRGITCELQVFLTSGRKGWGLRTLQDLPKGAFVCEYVGEIVTNAELYERNMQSCGRERHTYPVTLDADWGSERILRDEEALCLDATFCGNVARFINHRCCDANLIDIPVEVETPDRHYYHLAFFTTREVSALEELTWDYGIDFSDHDHPVKAFQCNCGSEFCRDMK